MEARVSGHIFLQTMNIVREALASKDEPRLASPMGVEEDEDEDEEEEEEEEEEEQRSRSIPHYQDSDSPSEYWDEDQEKWPIKGIVGEEITAAGELKSVPQFHPLSSGVRLRLLYRYEVSWKPWERADGSCTLWMRDIPDRPDLVRAWKQKQKKRRRALAEENLDIEVTNDIDIHNLMTRRRSQAYDEKLEKRTKNPINYKSWEMQLEQNLTNEGEDTLMHGYAPRTLRTGPNRGQGTVSTTLSSSSSQPSASTSIPLKPSTSALLHTSPRRLPQRAGKEKW